MAPKLLAQVTEVIPSAHAKFFSNRLKIIQRPTAVPWDEQRSVIWFLMLENVSGSKIHVRMCTVYGTQNVITKSTVNQFAYVIKIVTP